MPVIQQRTQTWPRLQLWRHAIHYMAEVMLEGVARIRTRCSAIGRHALSNDVREVFKAVQALVPPEDSGIANAIASNSSLVDNYLQVGRLRCLLS